MTIKEICHCGRSVKYDFRMTGERVYTLELRQVCGPCKKYGCKDREFCIFQEEETEYVFNLRQDGYSIEVLSSDGETEYYYKGDINGPRIYNPDHL